MTSFRTFREILIADAKLEDLDILLAGLGADVETWLVQPGDDAVARIFTALATPGLSKLHLLAHGMPGGIALGGKRITIGDFSGRYDGAAQRDLDIAFWSCETGAGAAGQAFVAAVAQATGARVAAAEGLVGHAERGGNWNLGPGATAPFSAVALQRYDSVLGVPPGLTSDGGNPATWTLTGDQDISTFDLSTADPSGHPVGTINMGGSNGRSLKFAASQITDGLTFVNPTTGLVQTVGKVTVAQFTHLESAVTDVAHLQPEGVMDTLTGFFGSATGTTPVAGLSLLDGNTVVVDGSASPVQASLAQAAALEAALPHSVLLLPWGAQDTVANLFTGDAVSTAALAVINRLRTPTVIISDTADVAQAVALQAATSAIGGRAIFGQDGTVTHGGLSDTVANLFGGAANTSLVHGLPDLSRCTVTVRDAVSVAQAQALQNLESGVTGGTLALSGGLSDTVANLFTGNQVNADTLALLGKLSGAQVTILDQVNVAQAVALEAAVTGAGAGAVVLSDMLVDTVANLFGGSAGTTLVSGLPNLSGDHVIALGSVNVAQAVALETAVTGSGTLAMSGLFDTAANLFGSADGTALISGLPDLRGANVTVGTAVSVAQAVALETAVTGGGTLTLQRGLSDTAAHLFGSAGGTTLVNGLPALTGDTVTVSDAVSVAQAAALETAVGGGALRLHGGVSDTAAHLFAGDAVNATVSTLLGQLNGPIVTIVDMVDVAQAQAMATAVANASGTLTLSGGLSDTVANLFGSAAASSTLAAGLPALSGGHVTVSGVVSVAQAVALASAVTGSGTVTLSDGLTDTVAHLFGDSGATLVGGLPALTGATVTVSDYPAVNAAQAVALETAVTGAGAVILTHGVVDTVAHLFGHADGTTLVAGLPDLTGSFVQMTDVVSVAQAVALLAAVGGHVDNLQAPGLSDTVEHFFGSAGGTTLADGLSLWMPHFVTVSGPVSVAQAVALETAVTGSGVLTLSGGMSDTVAHLFGSATGTTLVGGLPALTGDSVTVSGAVSVAQAAALKAAVTDSGTLTLSDGLSDTVAHLFGDSGATLVGGLPALAGDHVTAIGSVSVAQAVALHTAVTDTGTVTLAGGLGDSVLHLFGSDTGNTLVSGLPSLSGQTVTLVKSLASVAQGVALEAAVTGNGHLNLSYSDTAAHFFGSATGTTLVSGLQTDTNGHLNTGVAVTDMMSVAQLTTLQAAAGSGTVSYSTIADSAADLATLSGGTWTVNAAIKSGTNVVVSTVVSADELAAIDAANGAGTVTSLTNLPGSNFYGIETAATPSWSVSSGVVANVIDAVGAQTIHIAAGGTLNLSGSDGNNVIVFDHYLREQLHITSSGTTVIFSDANGAVASIATDAVYAATQTIQFSDGSHVSLTDTHGVLAINGVTIVGSASMTLPHFVDPA